MVIKSLTVTEDAYDALKAEKCGDESFSEVILRVMSEKKGQTARFFGALKGIEGTLLRERIKKRRAEIEREFGERAKRIKRSMA